MLECVSLGKSTIRFLKSTNGFSISLLNRFIQWLFVAWCVKGTRRIHRGQGFFGVGKVDDACIMEGKEKCTQKQVIISIKLPQHNSRPKQAVIYYKRVGSCALSP